MAKSATEVSSICTAAPRKFKLVSKPFTSSYQYFQVASEDERTSKPAAFFVGVSTFTRNKPDLILYDGPDNDSNAVACCFMPALSNHLKVGLGDLQSAPASVFWDEIRQVRHGVTQFSWNLDLPTGRRAELLWKRTSHTAVNGLSPSQLSSRNWKLVEAQDGQNVLAVFTSAWSLTVYGTLQFNVDWGTDFERIVLIAIAALYEVPNYHEWQRSD